MKCLKIKGFKGICLINKANFLPILLNKCHFLSLISKYDMLTFVMYLVQKDDYSKLAPMDMTHTIYNRFPALRYLAGMLLLLGSFQIQAQGWEIYFGTNKEDFGEAIVQTRDLGYIIAGYSQTGGPGNNFDIYVIRTDVDGDEVWSRFYNNGVTEHAYDITTATDGGYVIAGDIKVSQTDEFDAYLLKIDEKGDVVWSHQYGGIDSDQVFSVSPTPDGGYILSGRTRSFGAGGEDMYLIKTDVNGVEEWSKTFGNTDDDKAEDAISFNGGFAAVGAYKEPGGNPPILNDLFLVLTDANGNKIDSLLFGGAEADEGLAIIETLDGGLAMTGSTGNNSDALLLKVDQNLNIELSESFDGDAGLIDIGNDIIQLADGSYVIAGATELSASDPDLLILKLAPNGDEIFGNPIGRNTHWDEGRSIVATKDGGFAMAGINSSFSGNLINDVSLFKTDFGGNIHTNYVQGKVAFDEDNDCFIDSDERALQDWLVFAEGAETFFGTTDAAGNYSIRVDTGTYDIILLPKNPYWEICEDTITDVTIDVFYDTTFIDFSVKKNIDCPFLDVDISVPFLLPCTTKDLVVTYCNNGPTEADTAVVEVVLDEDLIFNSATITPIQIIDDSLYIFDVDSLEVGECGTFLINVTLDCAATAGETVFASAHILPDTVCTAIDPNWDMSSLKVTGYCDGDSVRFDVENIGLGDMDEPQDLVIIEDIVIGRTETVELNAGEKQSFVEEANGATYRIVVEQSEGHPGDSYPTIAIEGCDDGAGGSSTGQVTQFQEDENNSFISIEVQESISSTDAVLNLRGYPKGYIQNDSAFILANTDIEYHLLFQNTGTDTVTRVVIRDTLSSHLDLTSVRPGASSHPYDFQIYDNGILKFTFNGIQLLPDSGADDSFGFVKFKISQNPNNPTGTRIDNSAAIFLGYDEPLQSATTTHFIGGDSLEQFVIITGLDDPIVEHIDIKAYPNPFLETTRIEIAGGNFKEVTLHLFDVMGRSIREEKFLGNQIQFNRNGLAAGTYIYSIVADGQLLSSGKIIAL